MPRLGDMFPTAYQTSACRFARIYPGGPFFARNNTGGGHGNHGPRQSGYLKTQVYPEYCRAREIASSNAEITCR
jgi:hypothetical protein